VGSTVEEAVEVLAALGVAGWAAKATLLGDGAASWQDKCGIMDEIATQVRSFLCSHSPFLLFAHCFLIPTQLATASGAGATAFAEPTVALLSAVFKKFKVRNFNLMKKILAVLTAVAEHCSGFQFSVTRQIVVPAVENCGDKRCGADAKALLSLLCVTNSADAKRIVEVGVGCVMKEKSPPKITAYFEWIIAALDAGASSFSFLFDFGVSACCLNVVFSSSRCFVLFGFLASFHWTNTHPQPPSSSSSPLVHLFPPGPALPASLPLKVGVAKMGLKHIVKLAVSPNGLGHRTPKLRAVALDTLGAIFHAVGPKPMSALLKGAEASEATLKTCAKKFDEVGFDSAKTAAFAADPAASDALPPATDLGSVKALPKILDAMQTFDGKNAWKARVKGARILFFFLFFPLSFLFFLVLLTCSFPSSFLDLPPALKGLESLQKLLKASSSIVVNKASGGVCRALKILVTDAMPRVKTVAATVRSFISLECSLLFCLLIYSFLRSSFVAPDDRDVRGRDRPAHAAQIQPLDPR
jgi:hypothetical protein